MMNSSYIMNIKQETQSSRIRKLLEGYRLCGYLVRRPHMMIAAFRDPEEAEIAVRRLQGTSVDDELLQFSILRGQHASEFVGYERSISCYMCLRTLQSGARTVSIVATPPLPLTLAVESPVYSELSFNLGEDPQIILRNSRALSTVTSRDITLRTRYTGHAVVKRGLHRGADHFVRFMEILRGDISDSGGVMSVGVVLEYPLDALKIETFFGESVSLALRVVPGVEGESRPYRNDTAGESSSVRENGRRRDIVLYSSALNKPGSLKRASADSTSNISAWPVVNDVPLGGGANRKSKPHDSVNTKSLGCGKVLPIGVTKVEHPSPGYLPPKLGSSSGVSAFSDPQLKVRQFPFFSTQPTGSIMRPLAFGQRQPGSQLPGGGENTMVGLLKNSGNGERELGNGKGVGGAMENQGIDAPREQTDGRGDGLLLPEAHIKRSSSDSASSSWSFLHRSYNSRTILSPSSSASVRSVGGPVTRAPGQMQYTDDSDSEATDAELAEIVDLTVGSGKERRKSDKSGNPGRERRRVPIVDSSDSDGQSGLGPRAAKARHERSTGKKLKSKRKEKVPSGESIASKSREEPSVVQRRKHKSGKKGKGKEIAHSDGSVEFRTDPDEPGPSKPRKKSSGRGKFPKQVESASDCRSPAPLEVRKKKKKKKAEGAEEVQEDSDVDMDASDLSTKRARKERRGRQSWAVKPKDATRPLTKGILETRVARGRSISRPPKPPANTSSSGHKTKKRKRSRTSSPSSTSTPVPPPADLLPSPARPGESMDAALRRQEIQEEIHRINLQQHQLSVRESSLKHELTKLKYQAHVEANAQGMPFADRMCSACGEYGHYKNNSVKCKKYPKKGVDWYQDG